MDVEIAPPGRVLLVTAESASLALWLDAIADGGFTVQVAATAAEAIAHLGLQQPDVIVLDGAVLGLPVLATYQQFKALATSSRIPSTIPILTLTPASIPASLKSALESDDDLVSVFQPQTLLPLVQTLLSVRRLHQQVHKKNQELHAAVSCRQQTEQSLRSLLHALSHDLRNPTLGMQMVIKNLLEGVGVEPQPCSEACSEVISIPRSTLERMVQGVECHIKQIDCLLDAYSCTAEPLVLQRQPIQLDALILEIGSSLQPLIQKDQATLTVQIAPDLPPVYGDPCQIRRVFEHLITNALKHNPPGVELAIAARVEAGRVRCSVQDNGVGIPADQCQQLFGLHQRGTNAGHTHGLGVGLYLCQQIIQAHRSRINVNSAANSGALFWFELPIQAEGDEARALAIQVGQA